MALDFFKLEFVQYFWCTLHMQEIRHISCMGKVHKVNEMSGYIINFLLEIFSTGHNINFFRLWSIFDMATFPMCL